MQWPKLEQLTKTMDWLEIAHLYPAKIYSVLAAFNLLTIVNICRSNEDLMINKSTIFKKRKDKYVLKDWKLYLRVV